MIAEGTGRGTEPAHGLAARLRDASAAADRLAEFSFDGAGRELEPALQDGEEAATAEDFVVRAVHGATDPLGYRILRAAEDGAGVDELAERLGLTHLALLERVHELLQLGLVARDLEAGAVRATAAGSAIARWLTEVSADTAEWLGKRRRP